MAFYAFFGLLNYINYFQFLFEMWDAEKNILVPNKTDKKILQPFPDLISGHLCLYSVWKENQTCVRNKTCKGFNTVYFIFFFFTNYYYSTCSCKCKRDVSKCESYSIHIWDGKTINIPFWDGPFYEDILHSYMFMLSCLLSNEREVSWLDSQAFFKLSHFATCTSIYRRQDTQHLTKEMNFNTEQKTVVLDYF